MVNGMAAQSKLKIGISYLAVLVGAALPGTFIPYDCLGPTNGKALTRDLTWNASALLC